MTRTELSRFQDVPITTIVELQRLIRYRDGISVERSADELEEIHQASERALAVGSLDRELNQLCNARVLQRVPDRMMADLDTDLNLRTLAAGSGYRRSHFVRTARAAMGCPPHQWLTRLRVEQAKKRLRRHSDSLIDVALDRGVSSHGHFPNTLRQMVGVNSQRFSAQSQ